MGYHPSLVLPFFHPCLSSLSFPPSLPFYLREPLSLSLKSSGGVWESARIARRILVYFQFWGENTAFMAPISCTYNRQICKILDFHVTIAEHHFLFRRPTQMFYYA